MNYDDKEPRVKDYYAGVESRRAKSERTDFRPMRIDDTDRRLKALYVSDQQADNSDVTPLTVRRSRIDRLKWVIGVAFGIMLAIARYRGF